MTHHLGWALLCLGLATVSLGETPEPGARLELASMKAASPAPPTVSFREPPHTALVPNTMVYVVDERGLDYDYFRYGVYWYIYDEGAWYRARSYSGPFTAVEVRYVPRAILTVPAKHWRSSSRGLAALRPEKPRRDALVIPEKPDKGRRR